jgi:streptogramin lyase
VSGRLSLVALLLASISFPAGAQERTYTLDADFDEGTLVNVNHDAPNNDQLQLDSQATPFEFIWIAMSARGTVVKIDTNSGAILGEYRSTPSNQGNGNPSRTTVDNDGSVWVANRNNVSNGFGTVLHIGLLENGQCEDRNHSGTIETSTGLGNIRAWPDASLTIDSRAVATAADECIVHYTQVNSTGTRHVSVDANNDVWVSGRVLRNFDLVKGGRYDVPLSGQIMRQEFSVGFGGYGGLIDGNGVIWSAGSSTFRDLLRWDTANFLVGANGDPAGPSIGPPAAGTNWSGQAGNSYGLCIDSQGNVWNTGLSGNVIAKYAPDGTFLGQFGHGDLNAQGCVVDGNDHVWVAHSLFPGKNTVGHLLNNGTFIGNVTVGFGPTGVAVDAQGKIWSANRTSSTASRIDPAAGPIGADGVTPVGAVDLTVDLGAGGLPYNYSDMTGSTLIAPPNSGTWTVVYDSGIADVEWGFVTWTSDEPSDSEISVTVASSTVSASGPFSAPETVTQGVDLTVPDGQFVKIVVSFTRASTGESPILFDLTITANRPPECTDAFADPDEIWPPNHKFVPVGILGVTDPDGDPVTLTIGSIFQDEPVDTFGDGSFTPDGQGVGTDTAAVRAERSGTEKVPGDGRVYHVGFTADDGRGGQCTGTVTICVPHDQSPGHVCVDQGPLYDSTALSP